MSRPHFSPPGPSWRACLWVGFTLAFSLAPGNAQQAPPSATAKLFAAVSRGDLESARRLLDEGAPADVGQASARPLLLAAEQGYEKIVALLLERGADIEAVDHLGDTALGWAASNGHDEVIKVLLAHHATIDHEDLDGSTPLNSAIAYEHPATARLLIEAGANVKHADLDGSSILMSAVRSGDFELIKLLVERGADPIAKTNSRRGMEDFSNALTTAAGWGRVDALKLFLTRIKPGQARSDLLSRVLHVAAGNGQFEVVRFLVEHTEVDIQRSDDETPGGVSRVTWGGKVEGYTPLSRAVSANHDEIASYLVAKGARIEGRTNMADSVLVCVVKRQKDELARLFLDRKAVVDAPDADGRTALMVAAGLGNLDMTRLLLSHGASHQQRDPSGQTALHYAAQGGHPEIAKALLDAGASPAIRDSAGKTPRAYADERGFRDVAELLATAEKNSPSETRAK
jgi:ankyrin repeat protein